MVSRNKPKQTRNRSCFGLFRFEPKFIFVCFEDTLYVGYICNIIGYSHDITGLGITTLFSYISGTRLDWTANSCSHLPCRGSVQQLKGCYCYGFRMNGRIFGHLNFHGLRPLKLARTVNIIRPKRCVKSKMAAFQSSGSQRL
jgi:hypothetical protein